MNMYFELGKNGENKNAIKRLKKEYKSDILIGIVEFVSGGYSSKVDIRYFIDSRYEPISSLVFKELMIFLVDNEYLKKIRRPSKPVPRDRQRAKGLKDQTVINTQFGELFKIQLASLEKSRSEIERMIAQEFGEDPDTIRNIIKGYKKGNLLGDQKTIDQNSSIIGFIHKLFNYLEVLQVDPSKSLIGEKMIQIIRDETFVGLPYPPIKLKRAKKNIKPRSTRKKYPKIQTSNPTFKLCDKKDQTTPRKFLGRRSEFILSFIEGKKEKEFNIEQDYIEIEKLFRKRYTEFQDKEGLTVENLEEALNVLVVTKFLEKKA